MEESLPSWSDKNSEIKGCGLAKNGVKVMLKRAYSSYQRTEWFKITPKLLDPWICNLLMVQCEQHPSAPTGVREAWSPEAESLRAPSHAQWLLLAVLWAHWFLVTRVPYVVAPGSPFSVPHWGGRWSDGPILARARMRLAKPRWQWQYGRRIFGVNVIPVLM